jgi:hypothetical protein
MVRLTVLQLLLDAAAVVFLAVFVSCWIRYAIRQARAYRARTRLNTRGQLRQPGEQPLCEFTTGPVGAGLVWHDAVLAEVLDVWEREFGAGGGIR